ncbi:DUF1684 domain-containing protein [Nemorincola caseinilytica]|uniref:DUF1684 domain-containing protein n=1 Tax=Nemorincola caseinilytica TaxID=2054315 RepID=A0ABP8N465_9BACT
MKNILFIISLLTGTAALGQSYSDSIVTYRKKYIEELLAEKRQPIKPADAGKISFFPPDVTYRVIAEVRETPGSTPFMIPTHSGKQKPFREYCTLTFTVKGQQYTLHAYQGIDLVKDTVYKDHLFIPFRDRTNYDQTYGGGRYIDLSIKDISAGRILLDLNKSYNPYCAYAEGFNCPIPPNENTLPIEIPVGEKTFVH